MTDNTTCAVEPHLSEVEELLQLLKSSTVGLPNHEAALRLQSYGPNELRQAERRSPLTMFLDQFRDHMIALLLAAAAISALIGDSQDSIVILAIVLLNSLIGFVQEYKAEKAMLALKAMAAPWALVRRQGEIVRIQERQVVPGDIVLLEAGMIVPADLRLFETVSLKIDESPLTGESAPVEKRSAPLMDAQTVLAERKNMAFKGTVISYGRGMGVAAATGMQSELGKIACMLDETVRLKTPLQRRLARVGRNLAVAAVAICAVVFVSGVLRGEEVMLMLLTAISLAVAAVPEALPAVITICLALGSKQMTARQVLVRKLAAVETLGSITSICSDKTGTLTQNRMTVEQLYDHKFREVARAPAAISEKEPVSFLLLAMAVSNDVSLTEHGVLAGDPTETALYAKAHEMGYAKEELLKNYPRVSEIPFSSERQAMTTIHSTPDGRYLVLTKGGVEAVGSRCDDLTQSTAQELLEEMAGQALRVLAFGCRILEALPARIDENGVERNLTFLGLSGALDPPRPEARRSVEVCRQAGITPLMITGDHPLTARTIAQRLTIASNDDRVLSGTELEQMSHQELMGLVSSVRVYARVAPEHKLKLVAALQESGEAVAMTGDGVNDAPALKKADIGVAMGINGTDVAKEASDIILLDDNFSTIVTAIEEGRKIYDNIRKFFRYTLTSNTGEIWTIFLAPFLGMPIPLLPIHILWINLATDGAPGLALTTEPAEKDIMDRQPRPPDESLFSGGMWQQILWVGLLMGGVCLLTEKIALLMEWHWQTMVFTVLCLSQFGNALAIRSERCSFFSQGAMSNPFLLWTVVASMAVQLAIIYLPFLQNIFHTQPLSLAELALCLALSSVVFVAIECEKYVRRRLTH